MSLYLFNNFTIKKSIMAFFPFLAVIGVYWLMRANTMEPVGEGSAGEVLNNPYLFASGTEKLATEISTSLRYLKLLIFPHPLSADYSYNSIPYVDFTAASVWLSVLVYGSLILAMFAFLKRTLIPNKPSSFFGIPLDGVSVDAARILVFWPHLLFSPFFCSSAILYLILALLWVSVLFITHQWGSPSA